MSSASKTGTVHLQTRSRRVNMIWCWHRPITVRGSNFQFMDAIKLWQYDCYNAWCVFDNKQEVGSWEYWLHIWPWTWAHEGKSSDFCYCKGTAMVVLTMNSRILHDSLLANSRLLHQTKGHYLFKKHWLPHTMGQASSAESAQRKHKKWSVSLPPEDSINVRSPCFQEPHRGTMKGGKNKEG